MQNLFRRPSGVYVLRLAVPWALRQIFGKREIVVSMGTRELAIAKISAGLQAAQWRQRFLDSTRLLLEPGSLQMDDKDILQLAQGSPLLLGGGFLPLAIAAAASGIGVDHLLRRAAAGRLQLAYRSAGESGHLIPSSELDLVSPEHGAQGGLVIPQSDQIPKAAVGHVASGALLIPRIDLAGISAALLANTAPVALLAFEVAESPGSLFVPLKEVVISRDEIEVSAIEIEKLRAELAALVSADRVKEAKQHRKMTIEGAARRKLPRGDEKLSVALDHYIKHRVAHDVTNKGEISRIRNGCALLIEIDGDLAVSAVTTSQLRSFRDERLSLVPADENKIRLKYKTTSVPQSIKAIAGTSYPVMSSSERDKRMRWIRKWFAWLKSQNEWIEKDPAAPLAGEHVLSKSARRTEDRTSRDDEARSLFTPQDLEKIFDAYWFRTGKGELTKKGTYREFSPHYYWLPLLSLFTGGARINEVSQLHLDDIRQTTDGTWYIDFNEGSPDKRLKNSMSRRIVPIHPLLLELGFDQWIVALRNTGYIRLFPELKYNEEKGYGKSASKWFTNFKKRLGIPTDGKKSFHSFRHNFTNALPDDMPERVRKQMTGHSRGQDAHDRVYLKDVTADEALPFIQRMHMPLPLITPFDVKAGLQAVSDALRRKDRGRGASEELGNSAGK